MGLLGVDEGKEVRLVFAATTILVIALTPVISSFSVFCLSFSHHPLSYHLVLFCYSFGFWDWVVAPAEPLETH
jgi:hypothetical protein